jgi:hypothetical protein
MKLVGSKFIRPANILFFMSLLFVLLDELLVLAFEYTGASRAV